MQFEAPERNLELSYGILFIDAAQAKTNMEQEVEGMSLEGIWREGRRTWNRKLGKISISGGSEAEKTILHNSLYRTYERPLNISGGGRYYSPFDSAIQEDYRRSFYIDDLFRSDLMGILSDEDGGGMPVFVVFSMMGFCTVVTPGKPEYALDSPF